MIEIRRQGDEAVRSLKEGNGRGTLGRNVAESVLEGLLAIPQVGLHPLAPLLRDRSLLGGHLLADVRGRLEEGDAGS
eukprot:8108798-Alexandrium_andersonii.AAC.1